MPAYGFFIVDLTPVMDGAQSNHMIVAHASAATQDVMNLSGAVISLLAANNAARGPYSSPEFLLVFGHRLSM
jgi:hypothetical protein